MKSSAAEMEGGGFTDIHTHVVFGVDDGAPDEKTMQAMLGAAVSDGVTELYATSHVEPGLTPFDTARYRERLEKANRFCGEMGYPLRVIGGAEVLCSGLIESALTERRITTLGDTDFVLMEFTPRVGADELERAVDRFLSAGYTPVLAHIERYPCLYGRTAFRLRKAYDVYYQINCGAVLGHGGFRRRHEVRRWLREKLIDFVASDAHDLGARRTRMTEAWQILERDFGGDYADYLMRGGALREK